HQGAARLSAGLFGYERERVGGPDHRDVHSGVGTPARAVRHRRHHGRLRGQDPFGRAHRRAAGGYFLAEHAGYPGSEEIMIIDIDAHLGHYPFAQLRFNTAEKMVRLMDRNGISKAVVSSLHAVFYRDAHRGNEDLREDIRRHRSRFFPVATVNPKYVGWERDLEEAVVTW